MFVLARSSTLYPAQLLAGDGKHMTVPIDGVTNIQVQMPYGLRKQTYT